MLYLNYLLLDGNLLCSNTAHTKGWESFALSCFDQNADVTRLTCTQQHGEHVSTIPFACLFDCQAKNYSNENVE